MNTRLSIRTLVIGTLLAASLQTQGATTDPGTTNIANAPLITNPTGSIMPNLFLMMDDSDSMAYDYMPDANINFGAGRYGAATSQCNGVYYDPKISYVPPVLAANIPLAGVTTVSGSPIITYNSTTAPKIGQVVTGVGIPSGAYIISLSGSTQATLNVNATASGTGLGFSIGSYPKANFYAAWVNGFDGYLNPTTSPTVNLSTSFVDAVSNRSGDPAQTAFYYAYTGTQNSPQQKNFNNSSNAYSNECVSLVGSTTAWDGTNPVNKVFTKTIISSVTSTYTGGSARTDCAAVTSCTFAEESQNFANWYSYYHTRLLMMKTSTGLAFSSLSSNFRVGFATINNNTSLDYLGLDQFTAAQRTNWYNKLYSTQAGFSTPLREALAKVGKMYANQLPTLNGATVVDPIQFSCQQNFTILTTDGFWNNSSGNGLSCTNSSNCVLPNPPGYTLTPSTLPTPGTPGNQDGNVARPQYDGTYSLQSVSQTTQTDQNLLQTTVNVQQWTEQLQKQESYLQKRSGPLQWQTNQQITNATVNWQSNLKHTDATLNWQSNLQHTDATLNWQSNLQHIDAPLQWQTNLQITTTQQQWQTDQQQTTAPLQWQTRQTMTTAPLLWSTTKQQTTAALQWQTNLQSTTGILQKQTSQLQTRTTQLQISYSYLQVQTSQLQANISTPQSSTMYLQTQASSNSGNTWGPWLDATSCQWITSSTDGTRRNCRYVTAPASSTLWSAGGGTWTTGASCTMNFDSNTANGTVPANLTTLSGNGTSCRYNAWSGYANAASCTAVAQATGTTSGTAYPTAYQCQTVVSVPYANAASTCTATTIPNGSGQTTQCQYTAYGLYGNLAASSCNPVAPSASSPYTVLTANTCQTTAPAWTNVNSPSTCTTTATNGSGQTTQCQYLAYTAWAAVASGGTCTGVAQSTSSPYVANATNCQVASPVTAYVTTNPPTCTNSTTAGTGGAWVSGCGTGPGWSGWTNVANSASCATATGTGPFGSSTQCQMASTTASYLAYGATCPATNPYVAGGTSTASATGIVNLCGTNAAYGPTTTLNNGQGCTAAAGTVQCTLGTQTQNYLAYPATACSTSYPATTSTPATNNGFINTVVTACTVSGTWGGTTTVPANTACTTAGNVQCILGTQTSAYVSYAMASGTPTCASTISWTPGTLPAGNGTTNAAGVVVTACPTTLPTWSTPANIGVCVASTYVQCPTTTPVTVWPGVYPPTCTASTNTTTGVTTSCGLATVAPLFSGATNMGSGVTCTPGIIGTAGNGPSWGNTTKCVTGTPLTAAYVAYVANAGVPSCTVTYNGTAVASTPTGIYVTTSCPTTGTTYGANSTAAGSMTALATGQTCPGGPQAAGGTTWGSTVNCPTSGASSIYVAYVAPNGIPSCSTNYTAANVSTTVPASGVVTTACPTTSTTYGANSTASGTKTPLTAGQICPGGPQAAGGTTWGSTVNCPTSGASSIYVAYSAAASGVPSCSTNYTAANVSTTVPASGVVTTACPTTGTTYGANNTASGTKTALTAGQICPGGPQAAGGTTWGSTVNCPTSGASTVPVTTYPPTCATNYSAANVGITVPASGTVVTACPTAGFGTWWTTSTSTPTPPLVGAPTTCTSSATVNCRYNWSWSLASGTCTTNNSPASPYSIDPGTDCRYSAAITDTNPTFTAWTDYTASATCPVVAASSGSPYTVLTARNCQTVNEGPTAPNNTPITPAWFAQAWIPVSTCTPTNAPPTKSGTGPFSATGTRINCQTQTNANVAVPSCTLGTTTLGTSPFTTTTCALNIVSPAYGVASCTAGTSSVSPYITTVCNTPAPVVTATTPCVPSAPSLGNGWTTTTCSFAGGTYDTLADVAQYYYMTDLRDPALGNNLSGAPGYVGTDISTDNVPQSASDNNQKQHMTTFTLGLGASGRMIYNPNYLSETATNPGDYFAVANGSYPNGSSICSWQLASTTQKCNWPIPGDFVTENIDDLWHAAVDGRGQYFSAANPADLASGLNSAFVEINKRTGSAAAATTSTAFVTQGDNFLFSSTYSTIEWTGELTRQQIDPVSGLVLTTVDWTAQAQLDANSTRTIYTFDPTNANGNKLKLFTYANLTATEQSYFNLTLLPTKLSQFCTVGATCLGLVAQTSASGAPLVKFIAGDRTNEGATTTSQFFRQRTHVLGDIVDSEAVYIKTPQASFSDPGYSAFKTSTAIANRNGMVYVGANDGMLHAFRASDDPAQLPTHTGGQEDWAYIPSVVMPDLFNLADKTYYLNHHYYVDGSPVSGDICVSLCTDPNNAVWKTILVGGLNGAGMQTSGHNGGMGYYALDVTDPANPKALWEYSNVNNPNMGFTFGNPKIVKLNDANHTWVVLVTSGYDNGSANTSGDGQGHLFVLNAKTGALISDISTGVGTPASPSGLSRIDAPVTSPGIDATAIAVYGGDLEGNVWRFDINGNLGAAGYDAQLLATLKDASGNAQPITAKPLITVVGATMVVNVGTGRYLGSNDKNTTGQDSFYAIKDTFPPATTPSVAIFPNPRTYPGAGSPPTGTFVQQVQASVLCPTGTPTSICVTGQYVYTSSNSPVNFLTNGGWFVDFNHLGERDNTDPAIIKGTLVIATNLPISGSCSFGGDSYLYQLNYLTGAAVSTAPNGIVGVLLGHELTSRPVVVMLEDGTTRTYTQGSSGGAPKESPVFDNASADGVARRISWRELLVK